VLGDFAKPPSGGFFYGFWFGSFPGNRFIDVCFFNCMQIKKLSVLALSCIAVILFAALPGIGFVAAVAKYANYWFAAAIFASFLF
jgi:hypothetical protein